MQKKQIAVILSGCGASDGSEIHEATLTLLALDCVGLSYQCLAPNIPQTRVVNMLTHTLLQTPRNVLEESSRIARGNIKNIALENPSNYAGIIFPGGLGAALNLCDFALNKSDYTLQPDVNQFAQALIAEKKPAGFICIAPVLALKLYPPGIKIALGEDQKIIARAKQLQAQLIPCPAIACVTDKKHKLVSTPAYLLAHSIKEVSEGIHNLVKALNEMLNPANE